MAANAVVRARINESVKDQASEVLDQLGLSVSDVIRITLTKVANEKRLPFDMYVPNAETAEVLTKSERGEDLHRADSAEDLFKQLGI